MDSGHLGGEKRGTTNKKTNKHSVDGRNPAPVDMENLPLFSRFIHLRWCRTSSIHSSNECHRYFTCTLTFNPQG